MHAHRERRDRQGRRVLSRDGEKTFARTANRFRMFAANYLSGRFRRRLFADAGRDFSGRGRFRPDLSKQLSHFRGRNSAVRRHRGKLRCGRRLPACTLRQDFDDRGERALSRRSVAGQSRDWSGGRTRRTRRREDAFGNQRHRRFLREDR